MCFSPQRRAIFRHQNFKKCSRTWCFCIFISKCASRYSSVQFFDIRTSKSAPGPGVFLHFHFQMRFSPQQRAIFRHQNFKKCSRTLVFCAFSLPHVLLATATGNFSTSELQKVLRHRQFCNILTSKCAFRHSSVQFLISRLSTYLRTRRFNRPFRLTRHTNHWKNTAFRDLSNIWRGCIFFLLTFALLHLLSADLIALLCFSTVHIVGSVAIWTSFEHNVIFPNTQWYMCLRLSNLGGKNKKSAIPPSVAIALGPSWRYPKDKHSARTSPSETLICT